MHTFAPCASCIPVQFHASMRSCVHAFMPVYCPQPHEPHASHPYAPPCTPMHPPAPSCTPMQPHACPHKPTHPCTPHALTCVSSTTAMLLCVRRLWCSSSVSAQPSFPVGLDFLAYLRNHNRRNRCISDTELLKLLPKMGLDQKCNYQELFCLRHNLSDKNM